MTIPDWFKDIPAWSAGMVCHKCGGWNMKVRFNAPVSDGDMPEHLLWSCQECGAQRYSKCKDAPA
tara:strand:+ start:1985 stop:2179 length:195 start_codon:yes stop_codon:yes gene_type:complete